MADPRGIEERIDWFLSHNPSGRGMCAQHTWHSLGGDYGNPPAWGCADANQCVDKVKASGRYWTPSTWDGPPPRGAWVGYKYGDNGHACLSLGDGRIATTDPSNGNMVGIENLDYPKKWGFSTGNGPYSVWTDQYAGVRFPVEEPISHGNIYLSKLVYGQEDSDSVKRLQLHLNDHPLSGGTILPITGNYYDQTDNEVRLCQQQHGFGSDPVGASYVGMSQAEHIIPDNCGCTILNDIEEPEETPDPPAPEETFEFPLGIEYWFSGKPEGDFSFGDSYKKLDIKSWAPKKDGLTIGMIYANIEGPSGELRSRLVRENPNDETAYQTWQHSGRHAFLLTHVWFESGEANRGLHYEIRSMDNKNYTIGTRYVKFVTIPWEVVIQLAKSMGVDLTTYFVGPVAQFIRDRA